MVKDRTNSDLKQIAGCAVQDTAAKIVARAWDIEVETCDMHDGEKVGASDIGRLVRKRWKRRCCELISLRESFRE